jgi:galactonate dehydratase
MRIKSLQTHVTNAGTRNYVFVTVTTDTGLTGIGEATLEWQELAVESLINEWVASRVLGKDPFDIEEVVGNMIRDQYQGGSTVMTAISSVEMALWDIIGKATGQPVYRLMGGRAKHELFAYANAWFGGCKSPQDFAARAAEVVAMGYRGLKLDPFTTAWKTLTEDEEEAGIAIVQAVSEAVGPRVKVLIDLHGRLGVRDAVRFINRKECENIGWFEEPVAPEAIELLKEVKDKVRVPIAAGERLYTIPDYWRLISTRAVDYVQMDIAHCGGLTVAKKVSAMAAAQDMLVSPHCSIGPVAYAAAWHLAWSTPNMAMLESFGQFQVDWRDSIVSGWQPITNGKLALPDKPGLGIELDEAVMAAHPYKELAFPSLWDSTWINDISGNPSDQ